MGVSVFSYLYSHGEFYLLPISCFTMAPVEVDIIPRSIIAPIKDSKTVEKALTLPIVSDACNEVARYAEPITPHVETTYEKLSPMVELGYKTVLAKYEDSLVPLLPGAVAESVHTNYTAAEEYVKAAAEKVDIMASGGIDHLTEKLPQLKEATPKPAWSTPVSSRSTLQLTLFVSRVSRRPGRRKPRLSRRLPFWAPCSRSLGCTIFSASSGSRLSSWLVWSLSPTPPRRLRK